MKDKKFQLRRELMGIMGLNPWVPYTSASRLQMNSSHIGQTLVISGTVPKQTTTGLDREFGKYTFNIKAPADLEVIKVIHRYRQTLGADSIDYNPESVVIYQADATREIGMFEIKEYCSYHQTFGFRYVKRPAISKIQSGNFIAKDTIFADSPGVTEDGNYGYGTECNTAFMSLPGVSEDGIIASRKALEKFKFKTYSTRVVKWGSNRYPLNLYGTNKDFKGFPEIGDYVRPDGLLMCFRTYDPLMAVIEQNIHAIEKPNYIFDQCVYVPPGGRVIDIRVYNDRRSTSGDISHIDKQVHRYASQKVRFYQDILDVYKKFKKERGDSLILTNEFHRLVVDALAITDKSDQPITFTYHQERLDTWRVEFIIENEVTPTIGFKLTDNSGGKGVICDIVDNEEDMPIDVDGNRAELIMSDAATGNRENPGRIFEQYLNAAARDVRKQIIKDLEVPEDVKNIEQFLMTKDPLQIDAAMDYLIGYYKLVNPKVYGWFVKGKYTKSKQFALAEIIKDKIYNYLPPENPRTIREIIKDLEKFYPQTYSPVSFVSESLNGHRERITTVNKVRIGSIYMMLLEKTGDQRSAVSSAPLQHFGVLGQMSQSDKHASPVRRNPTRVFGESEVRSLLAYTADGTAAEVLDRNTSPITREEIVRNLLDAPIPTNIQSVVNRKVTRLGNSRPLQLLRHIGLCAGWEMVYKPYRRANVVK